MNRELLHILDSLEREKGINREILFSAIESALISAARKVVGKKKEEVTVTVDRETGEIKILCDGEPVKSAGFGRISAQTAKQVIIQKIREAERDVIFDDFTERVNTLCTGSVHRFEKGNVIVDLGRTEGILARKDLCPRESFKQGDRVRAYIIEVNKTPRGPQIIMSRTHPNFVKRLFELEVPEIDDGIVEIKDITREPGERTKMSVYSKDEKIDAVGACVGMRGQRVKNVVRELGGERIDIIRWSEDVKEYIKAALSPAEIKDISLEKKKHQSNILVQDDQLSLAIGKQGQNVRLASKLTGWNIDILSESDYRVIAEVPIVEVDGVGAKAAAVLQKAGLDNIAKLSESSVDVLSELDGIGGKIAERILASAKELVKEKKAQKNAEKRRAAEESRVETASAREAAVQSEAAESAAREGAGDTAPAADKNEAAVDANQADEDVSEDQQTADDTAGNERDAAADDGDEPAKG